MTTPFDKFLDGFLSRPPLPVVKKFSKLDMGQQLYVVRVTHAFMSENPDPDGLPIWPEASTEEWLEAYCAINPKILNNWLPFSDDFLSVVDYIEEVIFARYPGVCSCCNTYVPATPSTN